MGVRDAFKLEMPYYKTKGPFLNEKLTKNFHSKEFACKDGTLVPKRMRPAVLKLAENLQVLRDAIKAPITINSGFRHQLYNKRVGGATNSHHRYARAADIVAKGWTPTQLYRKIEELIREGKMHNGGLGLYRDFVHYDVRDNGPARWGDINIFERR